jgi:hypothetical protein
MAGIDPTQRQASPEADVEHIVVYGGSTDRIPEYAVSRGCTVLTREEPSIAVAINKGALQLQEGVDWILGMP